MLPTLLETLGEGEASSLVGLSIVTAACDFLLCPGYAGCPRADHQGSAL